MLSRREVLIGAAVAGGVALAQPLATVLANASQPTTPVNFAVPAGACDCHAHIFGDSRRFPFASSRTYTPEPASIEEMQALHRALHTERFVIVQPSVYGTDNACTLDAIKQLGSSARGVAVIDEQTPATALDEMNHAGVRGIRINLETTGQTDPAVGRQRFQAAVQQIQRGKGSRQWHIQIFTSLSVIEGIQHEIMASPVPVVFDHFGGAQAGLGIRQPGFEALLNLLRMGKAYVKISAPYRSSTQAPDYPDVAPLARELIAANAQRILWGSDWPHPVPMSGRKVTDITPLYQVDDGRIFNQLAVWAPNPAQRETILVKNPAKLYGF